MVWDHLDTYLEGTGSWRMVPFEIGTCHMSLLESKSSVEHLGFQSPGHNYRAPESADPQRAETGGQLCHSGRGGSQ